MGLGVGIGIWVDGVPAQALPLPDRGLDFGDGLFETMLLRRGQLLFLDYHLQRLQAGMAVLDFPDCLARVRECLQQAAQELASEEWVTVRMTLTRGSAPRGYSIPDCAKPRCVITASTTSRNVLEMAVPAQLEWAEIRWSSQPLLAGIKHLNRLEQVMAATEARRKNVDEVVVCDQHALVSSVSAGNIFIVAEGALLTPALESCGIAGTRRRLILEQWAPELGLPVEEAHITREQLESAQEVFYCNALQGLRPVARIGRTTWQQHRVCNELHQHYLKSLPC